MVSFGGGPSDIGAMNGAPGGSGGMNRSTGPPRTGSMNGMNRLPGKDGTNGINDPPGMRGMGSTRSISGTNFPQPEPTGPNHSTVSSGPPVWRRGREFPIDKTTGKIDRRAVGGTAGQNGIEKDQDLFIIESMGTPGRPFNPFQRDLQTFWAARELFWKPFDESARREREMWEVATEGRRGWLRRRR
ncbi:hypothetical protein KC332_g7734 [Hortaea werneckii]|nr:hypothetical protein KC350_g5273 [Hortaea werneckii]KAI6848111.1 hypothetical protein KC358_g1978 [Hortaea werneckii]KAI6936554.1 hypothetical protein KC348_g5969 [Hortaea werneckii]KAI6942111.1 hypothetical protein KC341_g2454 [Hortaea werneckii]KAI6973439.1 hypothetical protein KC321_g5670 [Hortaea werneckii]